LLSFDRICSVLLSACFLNNSSFIANWRNAKQFLIGNEIETQSSYLPLCLFASCCGFLGQFILAATAGNEFRSDQFVVSSE